MECYENRIHYSFQPMDRVNVALTLCVAILVSIELPSTMSVAIVDAVHGPLAGDHQGRLQTVARSVI